MSSPDDAQLAATIASYRVATTLLRSQIVTFLGSLWRSLGSYHDAEAARFISGLLPVLQAAEQHMAELTSAYLSQLRQVALGGVVRPGVVDPTQVTGPATRNGTEPSTVYMRPFEQIWTDWSKGVDPQTAVDRGLTRAESLVTTDLQRTKTLASREGLANDEQTVGFRRVLEGAESCGLCIVASTRTYHKAELLPIHPMCDCSVAPIYGKHDPGEIVDRELLQEAHAAVEEFFGVSNPSATGYRNLVITHQHGELGDILARRKDNFTGPSDLRGARDVTELFSDKNRTTAQLEDTLAALEQTQAKFPTHFNEVRIEQLRQEIASR